MNNFGKFNKEVEKEIESNGYHIFNRNRNKGDYPNKFPDYKKIEDIKVGAIYAIRIFVENKSHGIVRIDTGMINIKIILKSSDKYVGEIITILPSNFPIAKGQKINVLNDEILYEQNN